MRILHTLMLLALGLLAATAHADGLPAEAPLYREIAALDATLTDTFNRHDLPAVMALFADDVEFFHDRGGLQHFADVKAGFGGLFRPGSDIRRELVPGSLQVYPLPGFGAIQIGTHRFCHTENGKPDCGTFAFTHVWRKTGERWQLARVVSYGH